jgi:hypothetical protein
MPSLPKHQIDHLSLVYRGSGGKKRLRRRHTERQRRQRSERKRGPRRQRSGKKRQQRSGWKQKQRSRIRGM